MCLQLTSKSEIFITERDLIVFKTTRWIGSDYFISLHRDYKYKIGKKNKEYVKPNKSRGYHSYPFITNAKKANYPIGVFMIPKGSKVLPGLFGGFPCYVSNNIVYLGKYDGKPIDSLKRKYKASITRETRQFA